ncbi:hypothetical protein BASA50_005741 [Batrachochytrium salamandrivorans]|uniref:C2H2-type domain-containing protein n=1 Tax=Batrachochytrium salamandrivorans TaxID=1357716 RepID=A0ABQ8FD76_9FUNG|nr:hypothetical protein BASA60_002419 [Batrachochytrium salamandrivorans]KAH6595532.1 hypothetical protein BASA50_005741 [Batrachochytrium salamandrivorans]KAH9269565.1 hypothetical protein BASA83_008385 [Batrachochytrium salamandrivorans]
MLTEAVPCKWATCTAKFESNDQLLPHISSLHLTANRCGRSLHNLVSAGIRTPRYSSSSDVSASLEATPVPGLPSLTSPAMSAKPADTFTACGSDQSRAATNGHMLTIEAMLCGEASPIAGMVQSDPQVHTQGTTQRSPQPSPLPARAEDSTTTLLCQWKLCDLQNFASFDDLVQHVTFEHISFSPDKQRNPHSCQWVDCCERFSSFEDLTWHLSSSHIGNGKRIYMCEWSGCDRKSRPFTQRQKIMRHIQTREKPYVCPDKTCQKPFTLPGALTVHIRKHTGEKPFKCKNNGCHKSFSDSSNLTKHIRIHTGEKPFKCPVNLCEKKFARPDQVSRHAKVHRSISNTEGAAVYSPWLQLGASSRCNNASEKSDLVASTTSSDDLVP